MLLSRDVYVSPDVNDDLENEAKNGGFFVQKSSELKKSLSGTVFTIWRRERVHSSQRALGKKVRG